MSLRVAGRCRPCEWGPQDGRMFGGWGFTFKTSRSDHVVGRPLVGHFFDSKGTITWDRFRVSSLSWQISGDFGCGWCRPFPFENADEQVEKHCSDSVILWVGMDALEGDKGIQNSLGFYLTQELRLLIWPGSNSSENRPFRGFVFPGAVQRPPLMPEQGFKAPGSEKGREAENFLFVDLPFLVELLGLVWKLLRTPGLSPKAFPIPVS